MNDSKTISSIPFQPVYTSSEIAKVLRIPEQNVLDLVKDGHLPCVRIGDHLRIRGTDLIRFLSSRSIYNQRNL